LRVVDWIHLAQDRAQWQALVKIVMNFGFHKIWKMPLLAEQLIASENKIHFMKLVV
jgi:hypothetical protein